MGDNFDNDPYADAKFTAEISNKMQVPDRISLSHSGGSLTSPTNQNGHKFNELGMRQRDPRLDMQVPDRILVAGGNSHVASKGTPRELQLENSVMPPTQDDIRVTTPPRSIRLDEHNFPTATDDDSESGSLSTPRHVRSNRIITPSETTTTADISEVRAESTQLILDNYGRENMSTYEEVQLLRRQVAKLNHRLMAVELDNQQQQQREMFLTILVSAYFITKLALWVNRSL